MPKIAKKYIGPLAVGLFLLAVLFVATWSLAYRLGERHISELILHSDVPDGKIDTPPDYSKTIGQLRADLNRLSSDYDAACYNYQTLYDAYDALYAQAGPSSGHEKVVRPDSARGNQQSCYR